MADVHGVRFYILSGKLGLVQPSQPISYYDHLLKGPEVEQLAARVAEQLREEHLAKITFFVSARRTPQAKPYAETIKRACELTGVNLSVATLEVKIMSNWQAAMANARSAKMLLLENRPEGEKRFEEVLERHGEDGMIYLIRGEAYEALNESESALNDYRLAEILFPIAKYREQARQASARIERRLDIPKATRGGETAIEQVLKFVPAQLVVQAVQDAIRFVESNPSAAVGAIGERGVRGLIMYLERAHGLEKTPGSSWVTRTRQLLEKNLISKISAYEMNAVREMRNTVSNEAAAVSRLDADASVRMFVAALKNIFGSED